MESVLALVCIVFFAVLTYGFIQGANIDRFHVQNCRSLYIPEDIDLSIASQSIQGLDIDGLKKRARELDASREFVDTSDEVDLKVYIVRNSISDEHILFEQLDKTLDKDAIKREGDHVRLRISNEVKQMSDREKKDISEDLGIKNNDSDIIDTLINKMESKPWLKDPATMIDELKKDTGVYDY